MLYVSVSTTILGSVRESLTLCLSNLFLVVVFLMCFILGQNLGGMLRPVGSVVSNFGRIDDNGFGMGLGPSGRTSLNVLSREFGFVAAQLTVLFRELSTASRRFKAIPEGAPSSRHFRRTVKRVRRVVREAGVLGRLRETRGVGTVNRLTTSITRRVEGPVAMMGKFLRVFLTGRRVARRRGVCVGLVVSRVSETRAVVGSCLSLTGPSVRRMRTVGTKRLTTNMVSLVGSCTVVSGGVSITSRVSRNV